MTAPRYGGVEGLLQIKGGPQLKAELTYATEFQYIIVKVRSMVACKKAEYQRGCQQLYIQIYRIQSPSLVIHFLQQGHTYSHMDTPPHSANSFVSVENIFIQNITQGYNIKSYQLTKILLQILIWYSRKSTTNQLKNSMSHFFLIRIIKQIPEKNFFSTIHKIYVFLIHQFILNSCLQPPVISSPNLTCSVVFVFSCSG